MSEWIKCSERLPDVGQKVIGWVIGRYGDKFVEVVTYEPRYGKIMCLRQPWLMVDGISRKDKKNVNYWMPFDPPEEEK